MTPKREQAAREIPEGEPEADVIYLPDHSPPPAKRSVPWRGRPRVADPLSARFDVRCRPAFLEKISKDAAAAGLSLSAYVCVQLGEDRPIKRARRSAPTLEDAFLVKLLAELGKIGSNHNQLARAFNTTGEAPGLAEWQQIERDIQDTLHALTARLRHGD